MQPKKLFFSILFCASCCVCTAQFEKGMRMVGFSIGNIFYNSGKSDYTYPPPTTGFTTRTRNFGINLSPIYGWFISENTVLGPSLILGYSHNKTFNEDASNGNKFSEDQLSNFNIGIGGFVRNYFRNSGKFYPFGQFGLNLGLTTSNLEGFYFSGGNKSTYDGSSSGNFFANTGLAFGLTRLLNKHTGLDFSIGYNFSFQKSSFKTTTLTDVGNNGSIDQTSVSEPTQKFTNHGVSLSAGFQIFLERRKS